jgi:integrase
MQPAPYAKARIFKDVVCKGNKERDIFLDEVATLGLEEFFDHERKRGEGPLFPSARERNKKKPAAGDLTMGEYDLARLSTSSVRVILNRIGREACALLGDGYYAKIHPHRLRHERGYNLKMAGADPGDIQKELGHSTPNYAPLYSQPTDNERFEWLNSIAKKQNEGSQ